MSAEGWYTLGVIALVFVALVRDLGPPDLLLLGGTLVLALMGVITPEEAFAGFVNPAVLTIGALFVVAAGMRETGALDRISSWVLGRASTERGALLRIALPVAGMSAFLNNTPVVAMFIPLVSRWCRRHQVSPSRLLLPLSYLAILGGTCTLIGTSTNLVVNGLMMDAANAHPGLGQALRPLTLFELTPVGLAFAGVGLLYLALVGHRLLPDRKDLLEQLGDRPREYLVNMRVEPECRLVGKSVEEGGLRHLPGLFLIEIVRDGESMSPVSPNLILREHDTLTFTGVASTIVDLERIPGLVPVSDQGYESRAAARRGTILCEAVVSSTSPLIGKSIRDADFRAVYNAAVVAVHRGGERLGGRVGDIVIRNGDTLLLQAGPHFARAYRNHPDFCLASGVEESRPARHDKTIISMALLALLVVLTTTGALPVLLAAFLVAGLMVGTRCISAAIARQSVDWQTLITIGAAFGLGKALEKTGCAAVLGGLVVDLAGNAGPYFVLALVYLATSVLSETITNRAAVVLMFPVAVAIATQIGVNPRPLAMAVCFSAAAPLVTPVGYQTNLMVYGAGGYRYTDYVRVGLPLSAILLGLGTLLIPVVWPFG